MKKPTTLLAAIGLSLGLFPLQAEGETYSFGGLNKPIPDGNLAGLSVTRSVSSAISSLASVKVRLRIQGEFNGDLYCYIRQVRGTTTNFCVLLNRPGRSSASLQGYSNAGLDVSFEQGALLADIHSYRTMTNLPSWTALAGAWQPDGRKVDPETVLDSTPRITSLGSFLGGAASGEWTLYLADVASGGTNLLESWELSVEGSVPPEVNWPAPSDIVYGTALGAGQLNATCPVSGTFSYYPSAGTVLAAGRHQLSVTFTPADTVAYSPVAKTVMLTIQKASTVGVITTSRNPSPTGGQVSLMLAVTPVLPGAGDPDGSVQFRVDGAAAGGPVSVSGGAAVYTTSDLTHGAHTISAEYSGDANFAGAISTLSQPQLINFNPVPGTDLVESNYTNRLAIEISSLLANDLDEDGDSISFVSAETVSARLGTVTASNGFLFYVPPPGFAGTDSFKYWVSDGLGSSVEGTVTVTMREDLGPPPNLVISSLGNGAYSIVGYGVPGRTYRIQWADGPESDNWQTLGPAVADPTGVFTIVDSSLSPRRFYRSVYP